MGIGRGVIEQYQRAGPSRSVAELALFGKEAVKYAE
jgi:hypothetical protein